jgi:hypothetical protein
MPKRRLRQSEGLSFEVEKRQIGHLQAGGFEIVVILVFRMEDEDTGEKIEARAVLGSEDFAALVQDVGLTIHKVAHPIIETPSGPPPPRDIRRN